MAGARWASRAAGASYCTSRCRVEAVVNVDGRGQMVLPKEVRDAAGLRAGGKLAVIVWRQGRTKCCITLVKAEALTAMTRRLLGPMAKDLKRS